MPVKSDAAIATFVDRLLVAEHEWWIDGYVVDEARRNLVAKVPARSQQLDVLVSSLKMSAVAPSIARKMPLGLPEKDRHVLAAGGPRISGALTR